MGSQVSTGRLDACARSSDPWTGAPNLGTLDKIHSLAVHGPKNVCRSLCRATTVRKLSTRACRGGSGRAKNTTEPSGPGRSGQATTLSLLVATSAQLLYCQVKLVEVYNHVPTLLITPGE